jgi:hypothetical protein
MARCERCGRRIWYGRLCEDCKQEEMYEEGQDHDPDSSLDD